MKTKYTKGEARKRISFLRDEIEKHNRLYYINNEPEISDFEYDLLMQELEALESRYPELASDSSPTAKVGSDIQEGIKAPLLKEFSQSTHKSPMLSLSNTYDKDSLYAFNERVEKAVGTSVEYVCELKIDGSAISLTYEDLKFVKAVTRGDGAVGDNVTENIKAIGCVPSKIPADSKLKTFDIRGEIYMPWDQFDKLNKVRETEEEQLFSNPRNAAAGSLKLLNSNDVRNRGLKILLYNIAEDRFTFKTHYESLKWAESMGFPISSHIKVCSDIAEIFEYIDYWDKKRKGLNFPTDGVVIKVNSIEYQKLLGATSKFPRWATAYKFKAEQAVTKLLSIDYQVGRTGAVTPVANLEPVQLSGSIIKRASLHNSDQMQILDIHLGDYVIIEKGGEIIPKIVGVELNRREPGLEIPKFPERCPDCGTFLYKEPEESKHYCTNSTGCPTQIKGRLLHFVSRKAMDILAGEATIEQMFELGFVKNPSDFYNLNDEQLLEMEGWKERSVKRFKESIGKSLSRPFNQVLYALGIRHVGETTAKKIAFHFKEIEKLANATKEELLEVEDIGEIVADSIISFFNDKKNRDNIEELINAGVNFKLKSLESVKSDKLKGDTIVVSGIFSIPRDLLIDLIEKHSGKVSASISKSTSFIIAGENMGPSKIEKAKTLSIPVISEDDFFKIINN